MTGTESTVYVVTDDGHSATQFQAFTDTGDACACVVAESPASLRRVTANCPAANVLIDRSLDPVELGELVDLCRDANLATFGVAETPSEALSRIESLADYRLRHPLARKDLRRFFEHLQDSADDTGHIDKSRSRHLYRGLVGDSKAVRQLRELIQTVAPSGSNVLIMGETGTGKEIVARNIHYHSKQGSGPFVPVNCSAIPPDLLESELFGHKKGAFTGALSDRQGRFMNAAGGTLFLDEIGDMSPALQVKLLRVLEERIIYRVGCNEPLKMTARLVAATHRNLEQCVKDGTFREDLFYRLNVVPIVVPPLRDRKEDIAQLAVELSYRLKREQDLSVNLTEAAIDRLRSYDWPGNVRELANLIERLAVTVRDSVANASDLPEHFGDSVFSEAGGSEPLQCVLSHSLVPQMLPEDGIDLKGYLRSTEASLIRQALDHSGGTVSHAATLLHVGRTTLSEKVKRLGLSKFVKTAGQEQ